MCTAAAVAPRAHECQLIAFCWLHVAADTAARLFAKRGHQRVAVSDVAREAEVAEQTVYNYFPAKEKLVTDREEQVQDRLCDLIRSRPHGVTPSAAVRDFVSRMPWPEYAASPRRSGVANSVTWRRSVRPFTGWSWS